MKADQQSLLLMTGEVEQSVLTVCRSLARTTANLPSIVLRLAPALDQKGLRCVAEAPNVEAELGSELARISKWQSLVLDRTYSVASFWSPSDRMRRSLYHGPSRKAQHAWAGLFFLLTRRGAEAELPMYSATQYLAERATRRQSPPVVFSAVEGVDDGWHVEAKVRDTLLGAFGIEKLVHENAEMLASTLGAVALGSPDEREELVTLADAILDQTHIIKLPFGSYFEERAKDIRRWFHGPDDISESDARLAMFMELTYAIWHRANPTTAIAYTFPTCVEETVCILTVGSAKILPPFRQSLLLWFSKTLFFHPLAVEYQMLAGRHAYSDFGSQILNHNLKNHFLLPLGTHLRNAQTCCNLREYEEVEAKLESCRAILRHYDALAGCSVIALDERRLRFPLPSVYLTTVRQEFRLLFDSYLKDQFYLQAAPEAQLALEWAAPQVDVKVLADLGWLLDNLGNIVSNSIRYGRNNTSAQISVLCRENEKGLEIKCVDVGGGCDKDTIGKLQERIDEILGAEDYMLLGILNAIRPGPSSGGIGLRSCAMHLRVAWQGPCVGSMSVIGAGKFEVIMRFPNG